MHKKIRHGSWTCNILLDFVELVGRKPFYDTRKWLLTLNQIWHCRYKETRINSLDETNSEKKWWRNSDNGSFVEALENNKNLFHINFIGQKFCNTVIPTLFFTCYLPLFLYMLLATCQILILNFLLGKKKPLHDSFSPLS